MNTVALLGQAYSLLGFRIVDGVVGAGHPIKPSHSAVFAQIAAGGTRLTVLAARAGMTPQAMGEVVDELQALGYVARRPDPSDGRAKLIVLTDRGRQAVDAGEAAITGIEDDIIAVLGRDGAQRLRDALLALLAGGAPGTAG
jgi:DNA-binding MarR family transcriptional regulator